MKIRQNKGIGLTDAVIAIAVFMIFSGLVITLSYNIYLQSNFIKRNDTATNYIVELFEHAKSIDFNLLDEAELITYINTNMNSNVTGTNTEPEEIEPGYTMYVDEFDLNTVDEEYTEGLLKQINVTVYYKLGSKVKTVSMSTVIKK